MDPSPLVSEQIDAGAQFLAAFRHYVPVDAAFWLNEEDGSEWNLHVASDRITDDNFDLAYGEVLRILSPGPDTWLDPFRVTVSGTDDPLAKAVLDLQRGFPPGPTGNRVRNRTLGGVAVAEAYIYPIPVAVPS